MSSLAKVMSIMICICPSETITIEETTSIEETEPEREEEDLGDDETDGFGRVRLDANDACDIRVANELMRVLRPHQVDGIRFLTSNLRKQQGCILADYMGLGKTLQVIATIYTFLTDVQDTKRTVLVLCPSICIGNWAAEFKKWLTSESLTFCPVVTFDSAKGNASTSRIQILTQWRKRGGVLLMGYEMFRSLLHPSTNLSMEAREASIQVCSRLSTAELQVRSSVATQSNKRARQFIELLCDPGPDLVVLDEGHRMKDPNSLLCQSVGRMVTKRRLVLTGYPVQNSLSEYWCMVQFARPGFLGTYDSFRQKYEKPILDGNQKVSEALTRELREVVLRRGKQYLKQQLPPKKEWILFCKLSSIQHELYCDFLEQYEKEGETADLLSAYACLLQVMNHPDIIRQKLLQSENQEIDTELLVHDEWNWETEETRLEKQLAADETARKRREKALNQQISYQWAKARVLNASYQAFILENSGKMALLMEIINRSLSCGDKVVVFSQSVPTLGIIAAFLRRQRPTEPPTTNKRRKGLTVRRPQRDPAGLLRRKNRAKDPRDDQSAVKHEWFLQIDGTTSSTKRMEYIDAFSSSTSDVDVLLVSTRAGAEGINLHAANRLVLFDVSWNPSHDHQSMCRSHRIGQKKTVHVYRLVSTGTMERRIYEQQIRKVDLSTSVVDDLQQTKPMDVDDSLAATRFRGFLQPPSIESVDPAVDETLIADDDPVLAHCVQTCRNWLVRISRISN